MLAAPRLSDDPGVSADAHCGYSPSDVLVTALSRIPGTTWTTWTRGDAAALPHRPADGDHRVTSTTVALQEEVRHDMGLVCSLGRASPSNGLTLRWPKSSVSVSREAEEPPAGTAERLDCAVQPALSYGALPTSLMKGREQHAEPPARTGRM
jgi:hypothetical protein